MNKNDRQCNKIRVISKSYTSQPQLSRILRILNGVEMGSGSGLVLGSGTTGKELEIAK